MKGNRLNTAANTGSFVTGRQQLKQQRKIADNTNMAAQAQLALLEIQQKQALEADYDRLLARMDRAVAEGRMTREEADTATELEWFNKLNPAPKASDRITPKVRATVQKEPAMSAGWYTYKAVGAPAAAMIARYWSGAAWTMETLSLDDVRDMLRREWRAANPGVEKQQSRVTAGVLGILLGSVGAHRIYLGSSIGFLQLVLFMALVGFGLFWLVSLWGMVEGILILRGAKGLDRDFQSDLPLI